MRHYDEELKELQMQAAMKNRLETILKELRIQKGTLESRVEELSFQKDKEQLEVDRLEKRSLANYFYQVVGKLDEKLTKEKQDAYEAAHLDEAQSQVERLQGALRKFKTELADVEIIADMQVNIDGFLRFADYFFDGLFADWSVMKRISEAQEQVKKVKNQIGSLLGKLNAASASVKSEQAKAKGQLQELVKKAAL